MELCKGGICRRAMKAYIYIAKMKILSALAYRFDVISSVFVRSLVVVATSYFWIAVYNTQENAAGVGKEQMLTYSIISAVLSCIFNVDVENRIINSVREGSVAMDMLKPVDVFGMYLAEDLGGIVTSIFQYALPVLLIGSLFIHIPVPSSGLNFLLFVVSAILSFFINWFFTAIFSMIAFFVIGIEPLRQIKNSLVQILSGSIVPLWFFPHSFQTVLRFLPFMYLYQLPLSIYIGKNAPMEAVRLLGVQCIWVIILYGIFRLVQKKVFSNILIQGG